VTHAALKEQAGQRKSVLNTLRPAVAWYFAHVYGRIEGPNVLPWYCDPARSGRLAVAPEPLAAGDPDALFKLFVAFSMFQARRDTVILAQQRAMTAREADALVSASYVERVIASSPCEALKSPDFASQCTVDLRESHVDCRSMPGQPCHVKDATRALKRTGDMGKIPSSAWIHAWSGEKLARTIVIVGGAAREKRGALLIQHFSGVHRIGEKLATMFVSALSTPALARGLTPWFPLIDGNQLLVIDTNVARAVDTLGCPVKTYRGRAAWLRRLANRLDLAEFNSDVPRRSPRLVQQALFMFCSRSNRKSRVDPCSTRITPCDGCSPELCPFMKDRA